MRSVLCIVVISIFCSCATIRKTVQNYYYIEPFKEQEIMLFLKDDSIFNFRDLTGCNQFEYKGRYRRVSDNTINYLVFDSVKLEKALSTSNPDIVFAIKNLDTAWIINKERIFIHKQPFIATSNSKINLQKIRYKKLEEYYIGLLGQEGFLKVFGDGNKKEAKKRLLDCKLPDVIIK